MPKIPRHSVTLQGRWIESEENERKQKFGLPPYLPPGLRVVRKKKTEGIRWRGIVGVVETESHRRSRDSWKKEDAEKLDWRVNGRFKELFIKLFEIVLCCDKISTARLNLFIAVNNTVKNFLSRSVVFSHEDEKAA
ncbi:hypothetical protein TNCV_1508471 [Trichonephila clavipes]|nr:hypothetical protein TNCV_1508471 [Trichonephila clavipes]